VESDLPDAALSALSTTIRNAITSLQEDAAWVVDPRIWIRRLDQLQQYGRDAMANGTAVDAVWSLSIQRIPQLPEALAALAMLPGGVRICQVIFCAGHYPGGQYAPSRLSCRKCLPHDISTPALIRRDVVSIERTL
jgi:hypothetical protein